MLASSANMSLTLTVEMIGYCGRAAATNMTGQLAPYIIQATFILIPPAFFAATIYMTLARIIGMLEGGHLSVIKPQIVTRVFVAGDFLSFGTQGSVAGLWVHPDLHTITTVVVVLGLSIQLISFTLFAACALIFHRQFRRNPTARSYQVDPKWVQTLYMLYAVSALIVIRSIFRIIEYVFGNEGYPLTHEWTLYAFDSVPMILVTMIFLFRYPSNLALKSSDAAAIELGSQDTCQSVS